MLFNIFPIHLLQTLNQPNSSVSVSFWTIVHSSKSCLLVHVIHIPAPGTTIMPSFVDTGTMLVVILLTCQSTLLHSVINLVVVVSILFYSFSRGGMDRIFYVFENSNLVADVACSKEDCLAKLVEHDMQSESLSAGQFGWFLERRMRAMGKKVSGGPDCAGNDELTLEIETDLFLSFSECLVASQSICGGEQTDVVIIMP